MPLPPTSHCDAAGVDNCTPAQQHCIAAAEAAASTAGHDRSSVMISVHWAELPAADEQTERYALD
jgi:hypothetical protein